MDQPSIVFGFQEEWGHFRERNPLFEEVLPRLHELRSAVFDRKFDSSEPIERFVMLYGRMCMEEFFEILLMCGNGYGFSPYIRPFVLFFNFNQRGASRA